MKIVVCNIGSTSFKFQFINMEGEVVIAHGDIDRVGSPNSDSEANFYSGEDELRFHFSGPVSDQREAVRLWQHSLTSLGVRPSDIDAVGFKTVQAGEENGSVLLTDQVLGAMERYSALAPAHNPSYLAAIRMFRESMPGKPLVGVFEPGFHINRPDYAQVYGTPYEWFELGVRKYGYHGASLRYVTGETIRILNLDPKNHKIIAFHLGGSSSVCAFLNGKAIDTSMGFTPQSGLIQSARNGDIDPFVIPYIMEKKGITMEQALTELASNGGLKGISGTSGDMRDIREEIEKDGPLAARCWLARTKYIYDISCYMGSYIVLMGGLDAVCFTGGIGQKDSVLRAIVLSYLDFLGFSLDKGANKRNEEKIHSIVSKIAALVLKTNEEIVVARETVKVVEAQEG